MPIPDSLQTLARYLAGEFENRAQSLDQPIWYVYLRLWQRPVALFEDSITLFAEQASMVNLAKPYRQRLLRLQVAEANDQVLQVQYYQFKQPEAFQGCGQDPERLKHLTLDQIELLPGCILEVTQRSQPSQDNVFVATPPPDTCCFFSYQNETRQVVLGFEASADAYLTYDKGVDPETGKALWGAMMGPYCYRKTQDFSGDLPR